MKNLEEEYEASLRRAFVDGRADYIILNDRRQQFLIECAAWGQQKGWLGPVEELGDSQSTEWHLRLTLEGKRHFGLPEWGGNRA